MNRCYKHGSVWVGTIVWTVFHKLSWTLSRHFLTNSNKHQCQGFVLLSVRGSLLCWHWQLSCVCVCCGCRSAGLRHVSIILLLNAAIVKRSCVASWWEHTVFLICLWWPSSSLKYGTLFYCRWKKNIFFYCLSVWIPLSEHFSQPTLLMVPVCYPPKISWKWFYSSFGSLNYNTTIASSITLQRFPLQ